MEDQNKVDFTQTIEEIVIDFGEICRFCLAETNSNISIQNKLVVEELTDSEQDTIFNFVRKMTLIKMEKAEHFPSIVCENCYELIKACFNFSLVCQQSDNSLRNCYEKTLNDIKGQLNCKEDQDRVSPPEEPKNEVPVQLDLVKENPAMNEITSVKASNIQSKMVKWKPISRKNTKSSLSVLKADNIKLKYQRANSLSERLKETELKLAEDILRSNDMMLGLPGSDELKKALAGQKSTYVCPQCSLKFNSSDALKFHYLNNHEEIQKVKNIMKFQCKKCMKCFSEQSKLIKHYNNIHQISESDLTEEDINHKIKKSVKLGKRKFYCLHCVPYKIFENRDQLVKHLEECHEMGGSLCVNTPKSYSCTHCESHTTFSSRFDINCHLQSLHKLKEDEITWKDFKCEPIRVSLDTGQDSNSKNLKLFKVYVCTDCSPPVSFISINACLQHKIVTHDKEVENIPVKELSAVYVDSMDVFKQSQEETTGVRFKVLCKNCEPPMEFVSTSEFVNHMYSHHDESTLENWDIESKSITEGKEESKKDIQVWNCSECSASYFRKQSLYYHMKEKHNKHINLGAMKCPEPGCSDSFLTNRQLIQHGISAHQKYFANFHKIYKKKILQPCSEEDDRIKNFECDICQKKYVCKTSLKRHILKAHLGKVEVESVMCSYCGKTLSNKLNLKSHIEFVHEALFVSCPICKKKINFRTIGKHYKTHQTNPEFVDAKNFFLCNLCGKILKSKRGFEDHQKLHKNIRDQLCDICGSGFTTKKFLHLHKKIHEGVQRKVFECHQCDKVFSGRHTLNRHLLTHSGEKNFICEICSKCFYTLQELNRHVRYHKKEYRFDCQLCDMRFLDKSRFRHHMMRHRNIRPHKCQFCDKMFIVRGKMKMHMAAKHNVEIQSTKTVWKDPKTYVPLDDLL